MEGLSVLDAARPVRLRRSESPDVVLDLEALARSDDEKRETLEPPCRVLLHNDDVTPVEVVPGILRRVFGLGSLKALWITLRAHVAGVALVVVEPAAKAEAHVAEAHEVARFEGWAHLTFTVEPLPS